MNDDQCKVVVADNNVGVDIAVAAVDVVGIDGCIENDLLKDIFGISALDVTTRLLGHTDQIRRLSHRLL